MEKLEQAVKQHEANFIQEVQTIFSGDCSDRIKIEKLYQVYISFKGKLNTIISDYHVKS